jgi:TolB protein
LLRRALIGGRAPVRQGQADGSFDQESDMNQFDRSHPSPDNISNLAAAGSGERSGVAGGRGKRPALLLSIALLMIGILIRPLAAQDTIDAAGVIAYVNAATGDEIRLVNADGGNNRRLWAHGVADPHGVYTVRSLDWRPDGSEIAFDSTHENWCSINSADIYAVGADGSRYRRLTQGPACAGLSAYPKGTVKVPVENASIFGDSFSGFIYFQGAPSIQPVNLPPGGSTIVTFNNTADFGDGELQVATMIYAPNREISFATAADVKAGQTITTGQMDVYIPDGFWENHSPTWRSDGSAVGFFLNFSSMMKLPPNPGPLEIGSELQTNNSMMPDFADLLKWGPPAKSNQLLYRGSVSFDSQGVYLTTEGSANAGQKLVSYETYEFIRGLAWLPDGSGFIFSVEELDDTFEADRANLFEYNFGTKQTKRITNFSNQFAGQLSVSPDGTQIVFDRANSNEPDAPADLYIVNRDGSGLRLLAANGRAPDWGPAPIVLSQRLMLPVLLRPR